MAGTSEPVAVGSGHRLNWEHSIEAARLLAGSYGTGPPPGRPRQAMLRRAVSTAYYAMFHALCQSNADTLVGPMPTGPNVSLWMDAYRTLNHRTAKSRLTQYVQITPNPAVRSFANLFGNLQEQRISADYDPSARFVRSQVVNLIARAEAATRTFSNTSVQTRRALAVYLLVRPRT